MGVDDYPEHLNPFDERYDEAPPERPPGPTEHSRAKYNTWGAQRAQRVQDKPKFLERPWTALNITPKSKLVRRLSLLKTTVERMSFRRKRAQPQEPLVRSQSVHSDMSYRIISPKYKAKLREQAIPALARLDSNTDESPSSPEVDERLSSPLQTDVSKEPAPQVTSPLDCPEEGNLAPRPKPRKKKRPPPPPPPPPPPRNPPANKEVPDGMEKLTEDNISTKSSITQDLEKDAPSEDDSLAEFEFDQQKLNHQYD